MDTVLDAAHDGAASRLGRAAAARFAARTPTSRRTRVGSLAMSAGVFASGVARPVAVRRRLTMRRQVDAPGELKVRSFDPVARPPRWWTPPTSAEPADAPPASVDLPPRGLRLVSGPPPSEKTHMPGRFAETMRSTDVRVKRMKEVAEIGSLPGTATKLTTPAAVRRRTAPGARPSAARGASPGTATGDGNAHRLTPGAAPLAAPSRSPASPAGSAAAPSPSRPRGRTVSLLRRAWLGRQTIAGSGNAGAPAPTPVAAGGPAGEPAEGSVAASGPVTSGTVPAGPADDGAAPSPALRRVLATDFAPAAPARTERRTVARLRRAAAALPGPDGPTAIRVRRFVDPGRPPAGYTSRPAAVPAAVSGVPAAHGSGARAVPGGAARSAGARSAGAGSSTAAAGTGAIGGAHAPAGTGAVAGAAPAAGSGATSVGDGQLRRSLAPALAAVPADSGAVPPIESRGPVLLRSLAPAARGATARRSPGVATAGTTGVTPASLRWMDTAVPGGAPRVAGTTHRTAARPAPASPSLVPHGSAPSGSQQTAPAASRAGQASVGRDAPDPIRRSMAQQSASTAAVRTTARTAPAAARGPAPRAVSFAPIPGVVRRSGLAALAAAGTAPHPRGGVPRPRNVATVAAADFGPGSVAALSRLALSGGPKPAGASDTGSRPAAVRRRLASNRRGTDVTPSSHAMMSGGPMRLAVVPLRSPAAAGTGGVVSPVGDPTVAGRTATSAGRGVTSTGTGPGPYSDRPGGSAAAAPAAPATPASMRAAAAAAPGAVTAPTAAPPARTAALPAPTAAPPARGTPSTVRRMPLLRRTAADTGTAAVSSAIRPTTVDLLRSARVAPSQGIVLPTVRRTAPPTAGAPTAPSAPVAPPPAAAPAPAPSVAGFAADSVVHRFFQGSGVQIGGHRAGPGHGGGASSGWSRGQVPSGGGGSSGIVLGGGRGNRGGHASSPGGPLATPSDADPAVGGSVPSIQDSLTSREWAQLVDEVTRRIEARVTDELARRGRRAMPRPM